MPRAKKEGFSCWRIVTASMVTLYHVLNESVKPFSGGILTEKQLDDVLKTGKYLEI